jgi:hypothetical protein
MIHRLLLIQILLPYVLLACGMIASVALFINMKKELRRSATKSAKRIDEIAQRVAEVHTREPEPPIIAAAPPRPGLNFSKRVQAMRMVRRNEDISHISAALGVTRREVELLIRVQRMSAGK